MRVSRNTIVRFNLKQQSRNDQPLRCVDDLTNSCRSFALCSNVGRPRRNLAHVEDDLFSAFGYEPVQAHRVVVAEVAEGKDPDTLEPLVALTVQVAADERVTFMLAPDLAGELATMLGQMAQQARDRHFG